ncbi:Cytochrome c biogenesis protein CcsB [Corynebacterium heidelbergense]|uniref:Cytochrome C biogenesis protein ResB n=2 Tax=Corynebacterium heidelbergense TaxID=2055947 RepID=A0A364V9P6_9CORY|nr:cytochrome c biogenesis protein ResB [Corynebacterium heidelbergense]RAV33359.1 cytochrome C biogenesis protein ResB [Corynebacterium heidelbergense]WCZ37384.1 Cytochrome c biogenesis protein CcsB [Corynebacterium heidelbergense]
MLKTIASLPRKGWQWLTRMKTALVLLFLLSIAAIPGALLPQRSLNESKVLDYIKANGKTAEIFDRIGLFDVFSSPWFAAIYILLFVSLVGCILPRSWDHYKALRSTPPRAPKVLSRMPSYAVGDVEASPEVVKERLRKEFKGWQKGEYEPAEDRGNQWSMSAEKGYLREFANLIFHLALVGLMIAVAAGRMVYYEGQVIVVAGTQQSQFCNSAVSNFDSFRNGPLFDGTGLNPYCVNVKDFTADYLPNGQATKFSSNIDYATGDTVYQDTRDWPKTQLRVNHPLRLNGDRVYLQGHGYAPTFTITWPNGEKRTETIQFRPDDPVNFLSSGAVRWDPPAGLYKDLLDRRQHQISLQGLFAPSAEFSGKNNALLMSNYPALRDPAVAIDIYRGDTGLDAGRSQNIFSLDPQQLHSGAMQKLDRVNLRQGQSVRLDDGTQISFDGAKEFANLQISHDPSVRWVLASALLMLVGLVGSLRIKRRRFWVRLIPIEDSGGTRVEIAGLSRTDSAGWGAEFNRRAERILGLGEEDLDEDLDSGNMDWNEKFGDGLDEALGERD